MLKSGWFWLFIALGVFWSLGAYNRLVRLRAAIGAQFISLESVLLQYQEVVQQAVSAASTSVMGQRLFARIGSRPLDTPASLGWIAHGGHVKDADASTRAR